METYLPRNPVEINIYIFKNLFEINILKKAQNHERFMTDLS